MTGGVFRSDSSKLMGRGPDSPGDSAAADTAALAAVRAGRRDAFDGIVSRHKAGLLAYISYRVGDVHAAEDLLQELFLRAFREACRGSFAGRSTVRSWLFAMAGNCVIDYHRAIARRGTVPAGDLEDAAAAADCPSPAAGPAEAAAVADEFRRVRSIMDQLPAEQRAVLELKAMGGLTFAEIAEATGCPVPTVKSRMRYALDHVKKILRQEAHND